MQRDDADLLGRDGEVLEGVAVQAPLHAGKLYVSRNPLIRLRGEYFWEDVALMIKRCSGVTLGVHKNYRLIR